MEALWNGGEIRISGMTDRTTGVRLEMKGLTANGDPVVPERRAAYVLPQTELVIFPVVGHPVYPDHLAAEVTRVTDSCEIRKRYRIYPEVAALAMDLYLKKKGEDRGRVAEPFDERFAFPGNHWSFKAVEFFDRTDQNNNLVRSVDVLGFTRPLQLNGNILVAAGAGPGDRFFIIKESPLGESQLLYPGHDFEVRMGEVLVKNLGALYTEVPDGQWYRCYGLVLGPGGTTEGETLWKIRDYMKQVRRQDRAGGEMIMANTWGDRGQDGRIREDFVQRELQKGAQLGITHFQLDDGWQQGLSKNSVSSDGKLWDLWSREDWHAHTERFPSGLAPVVKAAGELGIDLGLWFHPSNAASYGNWEEDVSVLMDLYEKFGIRTFKIDGMELPDKNADLRMRNIFDSVSERTGGGVFFNVDVTAGRRGGYFYLNEYGNIFLENRYTDWGNYYPHWTLRNLWQLSRFVPPEMLQVEFLNGWRNRHMYDPGDPGSPGAVPFEYLFAITMAGQPLAWMEVSGLPDEAFEIDATVMAYRAVMQDLHRGHIFPIGQEPDGKSWTGFQSIGDNGSGYLLIYREGNENASIEMDTFLEPGAAVTLKRVTGQGRDFTCRTGPEGKVTFHLPAPFNYVVYRYETRM